MRTSRWSTLLLVFAVIGNCSVVVQAQDRERNSENTPLLKTLLERRPETDLNKDGVLTWDEAQQARRKMQETRQKREAARKSGSRGGGPAPTETDVPYGDHERHVLDFWQAESDKPTPLFILACDQADHPGRRIQAPGVGVFLRPTGGLGLGQRRSG